MELEISAEQMARITEHCQKAYPYEGCGILLGRAEDGRKTVVDVLPTGNERQQGTQHNRYSIPPEELLAGELQAEERGLEVIGYFHSHPDHPERPSEYDREHAWPLYSYLIVAVHGGQVVARGSWQLRADRSRFDQETIISRPPGQAARSL
jgi:proteasome lid subunit RPN8/RPN11